MTYGSRAANATHCNFGLDKPVTVDITRGMSAIRQYREEAGLTQGQLGALVGVTKASVSRYESGKGRPAELAAIKLEKLTGIDFRVLRGLAQPSQAEGGR
jgi:transcriptional regulator with XRE-family HTH domain